MFNVHSQNLIRLLSFKKNSRTNAAAIKHAMCARTAHTPNQAASTMDATMKMTWKVFSDMAQPVPETTFVASVQMGRVRRATTKINTTSVSNAKKESIRERAKIFPLQ